MLLFQHEILRKEHPATKRFETLLTATGSKHVKSEGDVAKLNRVEIRSFLIDIEEKYDDESINPTNRQVKCYRGHIASD